MAQLGTTFDANTVDPSAPVEVLPAGWYQAQIINSEMRPNKGGTGQYLWMEFEIIDGPLARRKFWNNLNLVNPNAQAVEIAQRDLSAICHAVGIHVVSDSEQLHFKPMRVKLNVRPAGPDKQNVHREAQNEVKGFEPLGGKGAAPAPAHTTTAQQQPQQRTQQAPPVQQQTQQPAAAAPPWRRAAA